MDDEQKTFDKLRRSSYIDACIAYTIAAFAVPLGATEEQQKALSVSAIEELGWTDEELTQEGWRREREEDL